MEKVTKDIFYKEIGALNVQVSVRGDYPYTCIFSLKNGTVKGKTVDKYINGKNGLITTDYYFNYSI